MKASPASTHELVERLRRIMRRVARVEETPMAFGDVVLSPTAMELLILVRGTPAKRMSELAAALGVTKGAVTQMVDRLVALGLVARQASETDQRSAALTVLAAGTAVLQRHDAYHAKADAALRAGMAVFSNRFLGDLSAFLDLMERQLSVYEEDARREGLKAKRVRRHGRK